MRYCPQLWDRAPRPWSIRVIPTSTSYADVLAYVTRVAAELGCDVVATAPSEQLDHAVINTCLSPVFIIGAARDFASERGSPQWPDVTRIVVDDPSPPSSLSWPGTIDTAALELFMARLARKIIDVQLDGSAATRIRGAVASIQERSQAILAKQGPDSAVVTFFAGWLAQIEDELPTAASETLRASTRYYRGCLTSLHKWGSTKTALAVADLSDEIEQWWLTDDLSGSGQTDVYERIFLLNPVRVLAEEERRPQKEQHMSNAFAFLSREARRQPNPVYVSRPPPAGTTHPLEANAAWDIIVFPPGSDNRVGVVGGYVDVKADGGRVRHVLHVSREPRVLDDATTYYGALRRRALRFDPTWRDVSQLRTAWIKHYGIGVWKDCWEDTRDDDYYDHYDDLLALCAAQVQYEVLERVTEDPDVSLLEIGYGTGALSQRMMAWVDEYGAVSSGADVEYRGLDSSEVMRRLATERLREDERLLSGTFPNAPHPSMLNDHFDIVFGSLVLHDIWGANYDSELEQLFKRCIKVEAATLVFADVFFGDKRRDQVRYWQDRIGRGGLDPAQVALFFARNEEMLARAPSVDNIIEIANQNGFELRDVTYAVTSDNPFGVMSLRRRS